MKAILPSPPVETEPPERATSMSGSVAVNPMRVEADPSFVRCTPAERPMVFMIQRFGGRAHQRSNGNNS